MTGGEHTMRRPCPDCACVQGRIETRNGQDVVRCAECDRYCYNAPRSETGREKRSLRTRDSIPPSKRARILERDNGTCVLCHHSDRPLDIGHLVSVAEGRRLGLSNHELDDDENLAAMCAECNSGLSARPISLRLCVAVLRARLQQGSAS